MDFLLNPNIAYLIVLAGVFLALLAVATPGTGLLELGALFCFVLAGYAVYNLSIHWWALATLALSIVPLLFAIRYPRRTIYLALSILLLIAGSVFLFAGKDGLISVDPILATVASALAGVSFWFVMRKSMEAMSRRPVHDLDALVGQVGEARSKVHDDGSVYVAGEMWSARSDKNIPAGSHIRVAGREGFVLVVEKVEPSH